MTVTSRATDHSELTLDSDLRDAFLQLLERRTGIRVAPQQFRTLDQAIFGLQSTEHLATPLALLLALSSGARADAVDTLAGRLTVPETHFFRVSPQIETLSEAILPRLLERRAAERRLDIWSAGCSTGEEPYTLAILLRESRQNLAGWRLHILGTDISEGALDVAREARYSEWSFRDTPAQIRDRYFHPERRLWRLNDAVRSGVEFARHNLVEPLPRIYCASNEGFDLVLCRNVTIYFGRQMADALYERLAGMLAPDGWLLLGPCDPPPRNGGPLEAEHSHDAVVWRHARGGRRPIAQSARSSAVHQPRYRARGVLSAAIQPPPRPAAVAAEPSRSPSGAPPPATAADEPGVEAGAQLALGMAHLESGDVAAAAAALRRAAYLDGTNALVQFTLGRVLQMLGETTRARSALLHARRLLAVMAPENRLGDAAGVRVADLRRAVEAHLAEIPRDTSGKPGPASSSGGEC